MNEDRSVHEAFVEGFLGVSRNELEGMSDAELAQWQAGWKPETEKHILADKEWTRRLSMRQLGEQFKLEERLAKVNRWWSIGSAFIGVVGTLAGVALGAWWQASPPLATSASNPTIAPSAPVAEGIPPSASQPKLSASPSSQASRATRVPSQ